MASTGRGKNWWALVLALVLLACAFVVYRGAANLTRVQEELRQARQTNQRLDQENRDLYRQVQRLRADKAALERAARREMGLVKENERVYLKPGAPDKAEGAQRK